MNKLGYISLNKCKSIHKHINKHLNGGKLLLEVSQLSVGLLGEVLGGLLAQSHLLLLLVHLFDHLLQPKQERSSTSKKPPSTYRKHL